MFRTPIDFKHCIVTMMDGGAGTNQNKLTLRVGNGDVTWTEKHNIEYIRDRGKLDTVRKGEEEPMEVRLNINYILITQDTANSANEFVTPEDAMKRTGGAATWTSTATDPCEPYAIDWQLEYDPNCAGIKSEIVLFVDFRYESIEHNPKAGTLSISGKCNATKPTVTRVAQGTSNATLDI